MLKLEEIETIFLLISLVGALLIASPSLALAFPSRTVERFSELYVLGPNHMAEGYPFNVRANETYRIFVGIGNHMGSSAHYVLYVKIRNQSEPLPNSTTYTSSPLPALQKYRVFLSDSRSWEASLNFSVPKISFSENQSYVRSLIINNLMFEVEKSAYWNSEYNGFFLELFLELWIYDAKSGGLRFHNRFVGIWLNMTC